MLAHGCEQLGPHRFRSGLFVGTGKYATFELMQEAHRASGTDMVTVAIRRMDLSAEKTLLDFIDRERYHVLPNTAGCFDAETAIRTAVLARATSAIAKHGVDGAKHDLDAARTFIPMAMRRTRRAISHAS